MRSDLNSQRLLDDILDEVAPQEFRAGLLDDTLHHARRRRQFRLARKVLGGAAVLMALAAWLWSGRVHRAPVLAGRQPERAPRAFELVRTRPFDPAMIVQTKPGATRIVATSPTMAAIVETRPGAHLYHEINDDQLLLLLAGRAALTRPGPHQAELLLLPPPDELSPPAQ
jgi:hypothetical protein